MPSQVLTKRRVKRRQQRQRIVSKNAKRNVRSVRKHRKTAKMVMRGGEGVRSLVCVLHDEIPLRGRNGRTLRIPICIIVRKTNTPKDHIYVFFNRNMTNDEATLIVKLLLGITDDFTLEPPLGIEETKNEEYAQIRKEEFPDDINPRFVKLEGGVLSYTIKTGTRQGRDYTQGKILVLDELLTKTIHKIEGQGKIVAGNGAAIVNNFKNSQEIIKKSVLPNLYNSYWIGFDKNTSYGLEKPPTERRMYYREYELVTDFYNRFNYETIVQALLNNHDLNRGNGNNFYYFPNWFDEEEDE